MTVPLRFTPKPLPPSFTSIIDLAVPDGPATSAESLNPFCSKLGGQAALLYPLPEDSLKCPLCSTQMYLVVQMDCPREDWPGVDRIAFVFGCNRRSCSQSPAGWKVIFQCRLGDSAASTEQEEAEAPTANQNSFWDSLMTNDDSKTAEQSKTSTTTAPAQTPAITTSGPCFPPIFLHIEEELIVEKKSSFKPAPIPAASASDALIDEEWSGEQYEKIRAPGTDASFTRFQKRVAHYPRQCVRYTVAAAPASHSHKLAPWQPVTALPFRDCDWAGELSRLPACSGCGRKMSHFQLQLMPAILAFLPTEAEPFLKHVKAAQRSTNPLISDGMEWGSVLVFTCAECGPVECVEGSVLIQLE
jgi:hypothetical protein